MYAATVQGRRLTFVVEAVWRRNMVIRDRETGTLWQQASGEALIGTLKGCRLEPLGGDLMNWAGWKAVHPSTTFALEPEKWEGFLPKSRVSAMLEAATRKVALPGNSPSDPRLPFDAEVIGVVVQGVAKAYPLAHLREVAQIEDRLGDLQLTIRFDPTSEGVSVSAADLPIRYQRTRWIGWYEFHPLSELYIPVSREAGASRLHSHAERGDV